MALQVWLPLTGHLDNQGLSDITVTNNGATVDNSGKLGKCYNFSGTSYLYENNYDWSNFNTSEFSLCCWYKEPSPVAGGNSQMICIGTSDGWNNIRIGLLRRVSNGYPMFSVSDGSSAVQYGCTASSFSLDTWNHIACTYKNGLMSMYINGVLDKTSTTTIVPALNSSQHLGIGGASNGREKLTGYLNDVRVYDHALSAKEVKELSKGLVAHYKLDDNVQQMNNCFNYPTFDTSTATGGWWHWGSSGNIGTCGQNTDKNYIFNVTNTYSHWVANGEGATKDYLCYQSPAFEGGYRSMCCIIKEENSLPITNNIVYPTWNDNDTSSGVALNEWTSIQSLENGFYLCKCEGFKQKGSNDLMGVYIKPGYKVYISEAYLENDRTVCSNIFYPSNVVYDSSGYNYNLSTIGTLSTYIDTPRNLCCTQFTGAGYLANDNFAVNSSQFTINFWVNPKAITTQHFMLGTFSAWTGNGIGIFRNANTYVYRCLVKSTAESSHSNDRLITVSDSDWTMVTVVYTGTHFIGYANCEQSFDITYGASGEVSHPVLFIGNSTFNGTPLSENAEALVSDFRIYATALSPEDIKELYNAPVSISNSGAMFTQGEFIES